MAHSIGYPTNKFSLGYLYFSGSRPPIANAMVNGPSRPINISILTNNFPTNDKFAVIPIDSPTVPNAETTSNKISKNIPRLCWWEMSPNSLDNKARVKILITTIEKNVIETVRAIVSFGTRRLKKLTSVWFLNLAIKNAINTPNVLVLIPPPHEPDDAPINIKIMNRKMVALDRPEMLTELNPAVRVVTD